MTKSEGAAAFPLVLFPVRNSQFRGINYDSLSVTRLRHLMANLISGFIL